MLQEPLRNKELCWYPDAKPTRVFGPDGTQYVCPTCSKDLSTMAATSLYPKHIHICQQRRLIIQLSFKHPSKRRGRDVLAYVRYCYRCDVWLTSLAQHQEHCKNHFIELDAFCGLVSQQVKYIVPADDNQTWDHRFKEFTTYNELNAHMSRHLLRQSDWNQLYCPHPLCTKQEVESKNDLLDQFCLAHGMEEDEMDSLYSLIDPTSI